MHEHIWQFFFRLIKKKRNKLLNEKREKKNVKIEKKKKNFFVDIKPSAAQKKI